MVTDEERRNVAKNIRNAANRKKDDLNDDPDYSPFAALYVVFCGVRGFPHYKDLMHLADLIDRPVCTMDLVESVECTPYPVHVHECSRCGHVCEEVYGGYNYCPQCGAEVKQDEDQ